MTKVQTPECRIEPQSSARANLSAKILKKISNFVRITDINTVYKTNRFRLAVRVYSGNTQRTSKRCKNISRATCLRLVAYFFVLRAKPLYEDLKKISSLMRDNRYQYNICI